MPPFDDVKRKVAAIVEGAAMATGATVSMKPSQNQVDNTVPTPSFDAVYAEELGNWAKRRNLCRKRKAQGLQTSET